MIKINEDDIKRFKWYVRNHVALVSKLGQLVFNMDFSHHDFDKQEAEGEYLYIMSLRNHIYNTGEWPSRFEKEKINKAVGYHIKHNKHHPEYWDDTITEENFDSDHYPECDASKMTEDAITEMCCDWAAVAIKYNQPLDQWYNKVVDKRLFFTEHQKKLIKQNMMLLEDAILQNNISFPGYGSYTARIEKFKEDLQKDRKAALVFSKANPLTFAHLSVLQKIHETDAEGKFLYISHDDNYKEKVMFTKLLLEESICNDIKVIDSLAKTIDVVLREIYNEGFNQIIVFVDPEKVDFLFEKIQNLNASKKDFAFDVIDVVALTGLEETKKASEEARKAAKESDFESFKTYIPTQHEDVLNDIFEFYK